MGILCAFYYLQALPILGTFVITIAGMAGSLAKFLLIFLVVHVPFVTVFTNIVNTKTYACQEDFSSFFHAFFTVFRMMLNMVDISTYDLMQRTMLYLVHMLYVFVISILLINFLIALMAYDVSFIKENHNIVKGIQKLLICSHMDEIMISLSKRFHRFCLIKPRAS